MEIAGCIV